MIKTAKLKKSIALALTLALMSAGMIAAGPNKVFAASAGTVSVSALNLRTGASTGSGIIGVLTKGTTVQIEEKNGDWYKVTATVNGSSKRGYVYSSYINAQGGSAESSTEQTSGVVNVSALNVRSGPSTNQSILGTVTSGTKVTILAVSGEWYKVSLNLYGKTTTAYVYAQYITKTASGNSDTADNGSQNVTGSGYVNVSALNIRSAASTSSARIGCLSKNTSVTILESANGWYKVKTTVSGREVTGYVFGEYITKTADQAGSEPDNNDTSTDTSVAGTGKVNVSALNVRKSTSTSSQILACISMNTAVTVSGRSGDWYQISVQYNGRTVSGYVYADYITMGGQNDSDSSSSGTAAGQAGKVNVSVLNLRAKNSTSSSVVAALYKGDSVTIKSTVDGWYQVDALSKGRVLSGYVYAEYIDIIGEGSDSDSGTDNSTDVSESDEYLLAALVYCESGNQSYEGQLAVANVVLNRVRSSQFPNTISEVIYQSGQFGPASSGKLAQVLKTGPTETAKQAAKDALAGNNNVEGFLFFNTVVNTSKVAEYIQIGDHIFYHY